MINRKELQPIDAGAVTIGHAVPPSKYFELYADAIKCIDEMRMDDAIEIYTRLLDLEENKESPWVGMATAYSLKGDAELAVTYYQKALAVNAKNFIALLGMGTANYKKADYQTAVLFYTNANLVNSNSPDSYWGLAFSYHMLLQKELAAANAKIFLEKAPDSRYRKTMEKIIQNT
jgi:tetratricopeptide (TPR) repeat protein